MELLVFSLLTFSITTDLSLPPVPIDNPLIFLYPIPPMTMSNYFQLEAYILFESGKDSMGYHCLLLSLLHYDEGK